MSKRFLPAVQTLEYLRGFLGGRIAWSRMRALPIISGAFGTFRRDVLIRVGGFSRESIAEDMELIVRLRRELTQAWPNMRIDYVPEAVCWTEAPERYGDLRGQRIRWHRGLLQVMSTHYPVLFNPKQRVFGVLAMPYMVFFEVLGPIIEGLGYLVVTFGWFFGLLNTPFAIAFFVIAVLAGTTLSVTSVVVEEVAFRRYRRRRDILALLALAVVENLGYRQLTVWWRLEATVQAILGREAGWGTIQRRAVIAESAADEAGVLTDVPHVDDALAHDRVA